MGDDRVEAFSDRVFAIRAPAVGRPGVVLYGGAIVIGVVLLPRLAAFGYFAVAAMAVLSARGKGRLSPRRAND